MIHVPAPASGMRRDGGSSERGQWRVHALSVAVFAICVLVAVAAQKGGHPITAAIVFLLGVTLIGALQGLRGGLVAAAIASLIYNFFVSEPAFRFTLASPEDFVPIIAFAAAAGASGLIAGQLKDRALAAEAAHERLRALYEASQLLQKAVTTEDLAAAVQSFFGPATRAELYLAQQESLTPANSSSTHFALAERLAQGEPDAGEGGEARAFLLRTSATTTGVLIVDRDGSNPLATAGEGKAFASLLSIALERCLLLEEVSKAELLRRSEDLKTTLLSSVSHDLRTPLSAISASASSLAALGDDLPAETRADLLLMIREQCERLDRYTANLLNLTRLQHGLDEAAFTEFDLLETLGTAIVRARSLASGHPIEKRFRVREAVVRADPVMLEQVFYNLLENACRYSPPGSPVLVSAYGAGDAVTVDIADGGPGIAPAERERIFDRFTRGQSGTSQSGSGLGLSIARGFTEAFGGRIAAVEANAGSGGTTMRITLPARIPEVS